MAVSSRTPKRRRRSAHALVATAGALLVLVGCSGETPPEGPEAEPTAGSTPLADYDTDGLTLVRREFCGRVAEAAVVTALGADPAETGSWEPGRRLPGSRDISNEFGCSWTTPSVTARAWVFAPPVTRDPSTHLATERLRQHCDELADAPPRGDPGVAQRCGLNTGATLTGFYGLVGDAWVGCEIDRGPLSSTSPTEPAESARVGEWCDAVLEALRTA